MELFLIRHGQTINNSEGRHQGWHPVELSELGRQQAEATYEILKEKSFDQIFVSDLLRTKQTAEITFRDRLDMIEYSALIREINTDVIYGISYDEMIEKYGDAYVQGRKRLDYSFCGGESDTEFKIRVEQFMNEVKTKYIAERVAVVTHGGVINAMLANILQMGIDQVGAKFVIDNCGMSSVSYDENEWKINSWNCRGIF